MKEILTKEQLEQLAESNKVLLFSTDESKVKDKIIFLDDFFYNFHLSMINIYKSPMTSFIVGGIVNCRGNLARVYFQNLDIELAGGFAVKKLKKEITKFEYFFKSPMFSHIGEPFYTLDIVLNQRSNNLNILSLLNRALQCDYTNEWETTNNHLLFSFYTHIAFLKGLYKRLDTINSVPVKERIHTKNPSTIKKQYY